METLKIVSLSVKMAIHFWYNFVSQYCVFLIMNPILTEDFKYCIRNIKKT